MGISRRDVLLQFGASAALSAAIPSLAEGALRDLTPSFAEAHTKGPIILGRNENAYGPSEKVLATMRAAVTSTNRYPVGQETRLLERVAALHGITSDRIVLGCGSSEILMSAVAEFTGPGKKLITALPTFELAGKVAQVSGAETLTVPLAKTFAHDLGAMLARADSSTGLVYICNPNNPTASITPR